MMSSSPESSGAVKPTDIFEEIWVHDIVDLVWEAFRLRRLKANLMTATAHKGLEEALKPFVRNYLTRQELAQAWAAQEGGHRAGGQVSRVGRSDHGCSDGADPIDQY
jgi:hypothetical protein